MAYGNFPYSPFIVPEEETAASEVDGSVFRQVQSPGSIVQSLPYNSPRNHTPRLSGGTLPSSSSHQSPLFPHPNAVTRAEEFRLPSLPSEALGRRISRRQAPASVRSVPADDIESAKDVLAKTMAKVWFERNADKAYVLLKKEQLANRTKELRKKLEYLEETEWYYKPVDELIGQY